MNELKFNNDEVLVANPNVKLEWITEDNKHYTGVYAFNKFYARRFIANTGEEFTSNMVKKWRKLNGSNYTRTDKQMLLIDDHNITINPKYKFVPVGTFVKLTKIPENVTGVNIGDMLIIQEISVANKDEDTGEYSLHSRPVYECITVNKYKRIVYLLDDEFKVAKIKEILNATKKYFLQYN